MVHAIEVCDAMLTWDLLRLFFGTEVQNLNWKIATKQQEDLEVNHTVEFLIQIENFFL